MRKIRWWHGLIFLAIAAITLYICLDLPQSEADGTGQNGGTALLDSGTDFSEMDEEEYYLHILSQKETQLETLILAMDIVDYADVSLQPSGEEIIIDIVMTFNALADDVVLNTIVEGAVASIPDGKRENVHITDKDGNVLF